LIHKGFAQVNELKWQKACNHVKNVVEPKFWKEDGIREEIPKFIININFDIRILITPLIFSNSSWKV
jgi:hypothetical protein